MATIASKARTVSSWIGGAAASDAPGGTLQSVNPANTDEVVAEVQLGDAGTFVDACRAARAAQEGWGHTPPPRRRGGRAPHPAPAARARDPADRPPGRGQQGGPGWGRHARDRQAVLG